MLNLINFAHSEVFIMGCFGVLFTLSALNFGPSAPHLGFWAIVGNLILALIVAMMASALTAVIVLSVSPTAPCASATPRGWSS